MNITRQRIAMMLILPLIVLALLACESTASTVPGWPSAYLTPSPSLLPGQAAYAAAQSTLAAGQNQVDELSHQATMVSLNMAQAADAKAQSTLDYNQRQLMELSIRGTEVSQNMAQAAATQKFLTEQTQMALNAAATAQSNAATATYSAYVRNVTQTAQAQVILYIHAAQTAQANATLTAYSLTATPWAAIQAAIVRTRKEAERQALWKEFVVTPLKVILSTVVVLLLIVGGVMAYRRLMPVLELRLRTITRRNGNDSPLLLMDGMIVDHDPSHRRLTQWVLQLPSDKPVQVEIIGPFDPTVTHWITEAEQQLRTDGGL